MYRMLSYFLLTALIAARALADPLCLTGQASCGLAPNKKSVNGVLKCCFHGFVHALDDKCTCSTKADGNEVRTEVITGNMCGAKEKLEDFKAKMIRNLQTFKESFDKQMNQYSALLNETLKDC